VCGRDTRAWHVEMTRRNSTLECREDIQDCTALLVAGAQPPSPPWRKSKLYTLNPKS